MAPELLPGIGAAVAMVAGAVVRALHQARRDERREQAAAREQEKKTAALEAARSTKALPVADCARHAEGHSAALARTHARINEVLDLAVALDKRVDTVISRLDRAIDRLDDIKDWTRPTGEGPKR